MNNQEQEKWIDEVMQSWQGAERAEASPFLLTRIRSRMSTANLPAVPPIKIWLALGSLALLLAVNLLVLKAVSPRKTGPDAMEELIRSYELNSNDFMN